MSWFVVDVEADGPYPPDYSMICFGAVLVEPALSRSFYGEVSPISDQTNIAAAAVSGISRAAHEGFEQPAAVMQRFAAWVQESSRGRPVFVSDNPAFDWQWMNYYLHRFAGGNPFGYSARRIGDIYCGMERNAFASWKHLRRTKHDHNPVNDARGNAEAILAMVQMGLKGDFS